MYRLRRFDHRSEHLIYALGLLFVGVAVGQSAVKVAAGGSTLEAAIDLVLVALPGVLLLYVGHWLARTEIEPDLYRRIGAWCLGGVAVMLVFLVLRAVHPGTTESFSFGTRAIALAIGSVAGLAIGIHEAQAISRRREAEQRNADLERAQRALEDRNEELERTRAALELTVGELEASNERLDQFASIASHDLREPLRNVTGSLHLLQRRYADALDDDAAEFVDLAVEGVERMESMVSGLLAYSRVEAAENSFEPVDLEAVLADVLADLAPRVEETDAVVEVDSLPTVRGDAAQLRQLFQNLLANAIDYAEGRPRVEVAAERRDDEWVVSVRDDGVGVAPEDQERIFEIFERRHAREEGGGSGIGLALCRRVVEHHGGEIWVDSEPGEGATFSFTIPRRAGAEDPKRRGSSERDERAPVDV